jgi:toxin ParE1/3/4
VSAFRFSLRAETDLAEIARYTLRQWGEDQTIRYIDDLEACCQQLAASPELGRLCDDVRPGLRRMERGRHVIFYRQEPGGILVSRVLHQRMLPERHPIEDSDEP